MKPATTVAVDTVSAFQPRRNPNFQRAEFLEKTFIARQLDFASTRSGFLEVPLAPGSTQYADPTAPFQRPRTLQALEVDFPRSAACFSPFGEEANIQDRRGESRGALCFSGVFY